MFSGIVSAVVAQEVATAQLDMMKIADSYFAGTKEYTFTYDISVRGEVKGDLEEFRQLVADTYVDPRGWTRANVKMQEVTSGGQAHVILASGKEVQAAGPGVCSSTLSCSIGNLILINDDRWMNATDSYNEVGASLHDYRVMVINHETGHFLGHTHIPECDATVGIGAIMLQQSSGLRGCKENPWPLSSELWVKKG